MRYYEEDFEKIIDWDEDWDEECYNEEWNEELYGDENWIVEYDLEQQRQRQRQKQRRKLFKPTTQTQISQPASNHSDNQTNRSENVGSTENKPEQSVISTQNTQPEKTTSQQTQPQGVVMNINVNRIPTRWIVIGLIGLVGIILLVFWMSRR